MRKIMLAAAVILGLAIPTAALGATFASNNNVTLAKGDDRTGTYYAAGQNITVNGNVDGDVICAGQTVVVNGNVSGDVICAGQELTVNGAVTGSVRGAGQVVTINGSVGRNVTVGAQSFVLGTAAHVLGELAVGGQTTALNGAVDHDALLGTTALHMEGTVGGNLNYMSNDEFAIDHAKVKGTVTHSVPPKRAVHQPTVASRLSSLVYWIIAGLLMAMAAIWFVPRLVRGVSSTMMSRPGASISWGALALVAGPAVLFVLSLTVVGIPLAILTGVIWAIVIATAGLFAGLAVGQMALGRKETDRKHLAIAASAGIPLVLILTWLPVLGLIIGFASAAWTMGGILLSINKARSLG